VEAAKPGFGSRRDELLPGPLAALSTHPVCAIEPFLVLT
jgi:hypothetical protein